MKMSVGFCVILVVCFGTTDMTAQSAYRAAGSHTSIIPRAHGFFSVGFAEARLGITFAHDPGKSCRNGVCDSGGFGYAAYASASARKGQDDMFANLAFNPGLGAGGRVSYSIRQNGFEYDLLYLTAGYSSTQLKLAELNPTTTVLSLTERDRRDLFGAIGYNRAFGRTVIVGVSVAGRRELGSMGVQQTEEICVPGTVAETTLSVPVCSHRYARETVDPLPNLWGWHARADVQIPVTTLGSEGSMPVFALVGAGSVDKLESANLTLNWAVGGAIVPAAYPGQAVVSLLAGFNDASNANAVAPRFNDRFVVVVTVGLPFEMILRTHY